MIYVPNVGEKEMLKDVLAHQALVLGVYGNLVVPDGNTIFETLTELITGGGRGYAPKNLVNQVVEGVAAANKWLISTDANGKALATYSNAVQEWVFNATDVADGATAYGIFGFSWVLPFDAGLAAGAGIAVGDTVTGAGGGSGIITDIVVMSGTWAGNDAAGYFRIKTKTGTFVNNEALSVSATPIASSNTGATGDAHRRLLFVDAFTTPQAINQVGFTIQYTPKMTLASA